MEEPQTHNWTSDETAALIEWRAANEALFTGRRNSSKNGWEVFLTMCEVSVTAKQAQKKWNNLKEKYKELRDPPAGKGAESGGVTAATWPWYSQMDAALQGQRSISPPLVLGANLTSTTGGGDTPPPSIPPKEEEPIPVPVPKRVRSSGQLLKTPPQLGSFLLCVPVSTPVSGDDASKDEKQQQQHRPLPLPVVSAGFPLDQGLNLKRKRPSAATDSDLNAADALRDEDELFLLSLLPSLKRLNMKKRMEVRMKFQQVLYAAEFED